MGQPVQSPVGLSGVITKLEGVSFCGDGATHLIHTSTGATRLKAANDTVSVALNKVADGKQSVTVMGYPTWGPECMSVTVYHVAHMVDVNKVLQGGVTPWPFIN